MATINILSTAFDFMRNQLYLNVRKSKEIVIGYLSLHHFVLINNKTAEIVDSFRYLGLTPDNKLSFDQHTKDICDISSHTTLGTPLVLV